eukprot:TRINITY_DN2266_c0_g1_i6.p1 TRINITY_DN2266_c0_g1~~TRINITY_DN2266_c0_g1_i6.p1  ORF type:complete len:346 (+),score=24.69 TRINITY_DN2266_c0_g1_i6:72-1040(+)
MAASTGAVLTSLILTPFDVVKTRLQSQLHSPHSECINCRTVIRRWDGLQDAWCIECDVQSAPESKHQILKYNGTVDAARKLVREEGLPTLWRGWSTTIIRSVPQVVIYYSLYEHIKDRFSKYPAIPFIPLWSGSLARTITTFVVSPIDLIRTKQQANTKHSTISEIVKSEMSKKNGFLNLWRGATPTLWRDVIFSGLYWSGFESFKDSILRKVQVNKMSTEMKKKYIVGASFISGGASGSLAAIFTHPFDVVLTRRQIELYDLDPQRKAPPSTTLSVMKTIVKEEGYAGLLTGWAPRVLKITPACAIMISTYEFAKTFFGTD